MGSVSKKPNLKVLDQPGFVAYDYDPEKFEVTDEMVQVFDWDGGIVVRNLFNKEEVKHILRALTETDALTSRAWDLPDGEGRSSRLVIWSHPGNDVTGMVAKCEKVARTAEKLLRGEVYHYHTKLMMKEARTGGKHLWHQDYGYWYKNGALRPDMLTAYIAIDPCVKANGCVQFVKGSHRCGRIDHDLVHGQTVANQETLDHIRNADGFEHCYGELQPGDCLFFHSNVLHTSDKNDSDMRRWAFLCCYNRADNDPVLKHHHPNYTPLDIVPNDSVLKCTNFTDMSGKDIMNPKEDKTVKAKTK